MNKAQKILFTSFVIAIFIITNSNNEWITSPAPEITKGEVTGITDGDTLRAIIKGEQERIRLAYIDCPESDQAGGSAATATLRRAVERHSVQFKIVDVDRYDRKIAEVYASDKNVNLYLVRSGKCYVYRKYAQGKQDYFDAESEAQKSLLGVHKDANAIKPWDWRRLK